MKRRELLSGALSAAAMSMAPRAWALGDSARLDIAELDLGAGSLQRPDAWKQLL